MTRIGTAIVVAGLCATPLVVHLSVLLGWPPLVTRSVVGLQLMALMTAVLLRMSLRHRWLKALAAAGMAGALVSIASVTDATIASGVPHTAIHATLLFAFAESLRTGREPLVTGVIARIRGPLPPELIAYGRHVTIAWSIYFAAQLAASGALIALAPLETWSLFVNVLSLPLMFVMFLAEFGYRTVRFRHLPRSRVADLVKVLIQWRDPTYVPRRAGGDAA